MRSISLVQCCETWGMHSVLQPVQAGQNVQEAGPLCCVPMHAPEREVLVLGGGGVRELERLVVDGHVENDLRTPP